MQVSFPPARGASPLLCALIVAAAVQTAAPAPSQTLRGLWYEDETRGFRFRIPRDYVQVPLQENERWTVAMFRSEKEYAGSVRDGDSGWPHHPMLKVILFDEEAIARSSSVEVTPGLTVEVGRPYRDYKDYLRINRSAGGYFFDQEEEATINKIPVTQYEVKVEKVARDRLRYLTWVFHGDGYDFAIEVEILEAQYRKLRNALYGSFRSFKFIPRVETEAIEPANASTATLEDKDWEEMTVKERLAWRQAQEDRRETRLRARLPGDWEVIETDDLLVMTHAGRSYTRNIVTMAEACREYMDERFGSLSDNYVRRTVIRICQDYDEYRAYYVGGSADSFLLFAFGDGEITDYAESTPSLAMIFDGVFWHYLSEKLGSAYFDIPYWLQSALRSYTRNAQIKGRRLVFEPIAAEKTAFRDLLRNNRDAIKTPLELMQMNSRDISEGYEKEHNLPAQFLALLRFIEGPGQRHDLLEDRDFLIEYIAEVLETTVEYEKQNRIVRKPMKEPTSELEEEQQALERRQRSRQYADESAARQKEILALVTKAACPWTAEQWEDLNEAYTRFWRSY